MENTNIIRTTYEHDDFGTLRVIYNAGKFYFCAKDICRILEVNGRHGTDYCKNISKGVHQTNGGLHVMNFIDIADVMRLYKHSKSRFAEEFILSIDELEEDFERSLFGDDYDDDFEDEWDDCEIVEDPEEEDNEGESHYCMNDEEFAEKLYDFVDGLDNVHKFVSDLFEDPSNAMKLFLASLDYNSDTTKTE